MILSAPDRLELLLADDQNAVTGIDFVEVETDSKTLNVHFFKSLETTSPTHTPIAREDIEIYRILDDGRRFNVSLSQDVEPTVTDPDILQIVVDKVGDFSTYRLKIDHPEIDSYYNDIEISFKAFCPRDVDCKQKQHECLEEELLDYPVDYLARDFWSIKNALEEFTSQRYPKWQDNKREADVGVMFAEVLSALGDEMSYYQDRIAREAYLETATQRRSVKRHARLVDYEMRNGMVAKTWLTISVKEGRKGTVPAGFQIYASSDYGSTITFEVGEDLRQILQGKRFAVDSARNLLFPHIWNEDATCLPIGTTELIIKGHHGDSIPVGGSENGDGHWIVLQTKPDSPDVPARSWLVKITSVGDEDKNGNPLVDDLILDDAGQPTKYSKLSWEQEHALPFEMDLTCLVIWGNIVPIFAGETKETHIVIGDFKEHSNLSWQQKREIDSAIERNGPDNEVTYLYSLTGSNIEGLCWNGNDVSSAVPEVYVVEDGLEETTGDWRSKQVDFSHPCEQSINEWCWKQKLVGERSSNPQDAVFTLDDGYWTRVVGYYRNGAEIVHRDYKSDAGATIRFGDNEFGKTPREGTLFKIFYRLGNGSYANVSAQSINRFNEQQSVLDENDNAIVSSDLIHSVVNHLPASSGVDPEDIEHARRMAPQAFRHHTYRAVTEQDYADAAEQLSWVQRAGAKFRWTGSWLTAFVTPDPYGAVSLTNPQKNELLHQMHRYRQAGRETAMLKAKYVNLDLEIRVCVMETAYKSQVEEKIAEVLLGRKGTKASRGFFSADNFTFGTSLSRAGLESVIQEVPGVKAVEDIFIARRGFFKKKLFTDYEYMVAADEVIRVENNPNRPEWGSVNLVMKGGA